ncbi:MAG: hypothetical protein IKW05_05105 [Muribaculaceae bacterium]|nr:hypothetical protein [Muribaculaceae bacterium]MBR5533193.1 hypothetical protein [Bacteroidales bacterium]
MKKFVLGLLVIFLAPFSSFASDMFEYDVECGGAISKEGYYMVKVWVYSANKKVTPDELKKAAVHGALFRGVSASGECRSFKPLAGSAIAESQHKDFFNSFFGADKQYLSYVTLASTPYEYIKVSKKYKVGTIAIISKDALRKDLEKAGVIRGLSTGF